VFKVKPARNINGKYILPPSPDLLLLTAVIALVRRQKVTVTPVVNNPALIEQWRTLFTGHLTVDASDDAVSFIPVDDDPAVRICFESTDIPWRDIIVFALLGAGKTVVFRSITDDRIGAWQQQAKRFGGTVTVETWETSKCLSLTKCTFLSSEDTTIAETDLHPLLGTLLGAGKTQKWVVTYPVSSPLRTVAATFGFTLKVKSLQVVERNEIARRLRMMQQKRRGGSGGSQQFSVFADFTPPTEQEDKAAAVTLPGDELLGAVFTAAKCLFPKSSFTIGNLSLESWATPCLAYIRKMGCKISVQETGRTSFGSVGILHIQTASLSGRKVECIPAGQYVPFLPAMVVIAAFAEGESVFRELGDLRLDTPDGIDLLETCIRALGTRHGEMPDGIVLKGGRDFDGFDLPDPLPAPVAAAFAIAALRCIGETNINDDLLSLRIPDFKELLNTYGEFRD
jgi:hypothetical protein